MHYKYGYPCEPLPCCLGTVVEKSTPWETKRRQIVHVVHDIVHLIQNV